MVLTKKETTKVLTVIWEVRVNIVQREEGLQLLSLPIKGERRMRGRLRGGGLGRASEYD